MPWVKDVWTVVRIVAHAVFIAIGCLIPVWMHFRYKSDTVHKTKVKTYEMPTLIFVLVCIILAGVLTEPVADDEADVSEKELERQMEKFLVGGIGAILFRYVSLSYRAISRCMLP